MLLSGDTVANWFINEACDRLPRPTGSNVSTLRPSIFDKRAFILLTDSSTSLDVTWSWHTWVRSGSRESLGLSDSSVVNRSGAVLATGKKNN